MKFCCALVFAVCPSPGLKPDSPGGRVAISVASDHSSSLHKTRYLKFTLTLVGGTAYQGRGGKMAMFLAVKLKMTERSVLNPSSQWGRQIEFLGKAIGISI